MTSVQLFYSKYCPGSALIINFLKTHPEIANSISVVCIDDYYINYRKFPEGVRGTPTMFIDSPDSNEIKAINNGNSILNFLKSISTQRQEHSQSQNSNPGGIPNDWHVNPMTTNNNQQQEQYNNQSQYNNQPQQPTTNSMQNLSNKTNTQMSSFNMNKNQPQAIPQNLNMNPNKQAPDGHNPFEIKVSEQNNSKIDTSSLSYNPTVSIPNSQSNVQLTPGYNPFSQDVKGKKQGDELNEKLKQLEAMRS